jgi:hypothetical protein
LGLSEVGHRCLFWGKRGEKWLEVKGAQGDEIAYRCTFLKNRVWKSKRAQGRELLFQKIFELKSGGDLN